MGQKQSQSYDLNEESTKIACRRSNLPISGGSLTNVTKIVISDEKPINEKIDVSTFFFAPINHPML